MSLNLSQFATPHSNNHLIRTRDLDEAHEFISRNIVPYNYKCIDKHWRQGDALFHNFAELGDVDLIYIRYGRKVVINTGDLKDAYLLQIAHRGNCSITHENQTVQNGNGRWSIVSPDRPYRMVWSDDCALFELKIKKEALHKTYSSITGGQIDLPLRFDFQFETDPYFIDCVSSLLSYLCHEAEENRKTPNPFNLSLRHIEELLISLILERQPHNYFKEFTRMDARPLPQYINRAVDYIYANASRPMTLAMIAEAAGISIRTLNAGFRKYQDCSPMEFLKNIRLDRARAVLAHATPADTSVTSVALNWGFNHLGRFAHDYYGRFGEYPQETLKKPKFI